MKKIEFKKGEFLIYEDNPLEGRVVVVSQEQQRKEDLQKEIEELLEIYRNDKKLLEWAKQEYPVIVGLERLESELTKINETLRNISSDKV
jgi:hypothetical protein